MSRMQGGRERGRKEGTMECPGYLNQSDIKNLPFHPLPPSSWVPNVTVIRVPPPPGVHRGRAHRVGMDRQPGFSEER